MKTYNVYKKVITEYREYLKLIGIIQAKDRNDACSQFRNGEYKDDFLTAKLAA